MDAEGISRLFTAPVSACVATPPMYDAPLFPAEEAAVAKAVARRRREFAAGRACARAALERLGAQAGAIPRGPDRAPVWPGGHVGSIAHCDGFCAAVVARPGTARSLGLDAEAAAPLAPDMAAHVCRPEELARFAALPDPVGSSWPKLAFSAKEAFYKCYFPIARTYLGFEDVSVWFSDDRFRIVLEAPGKPMAAAAEAFQGLWRVDDRRVYAGVTLPPL